MYGRQGSREITVMLLSFAAGFAFATFFNVSLKDAPLTPQRESQQRKG